MSSKNNKSICHGRIVFDKFKKILEEKDCNKEEKINIINTVFSNFKKAIKILIKLKEIIKIKNLYYRFN